MWKTLENLFSPRIRHRKRTPSGERMPRALAEVIREC
jgi:hypothetical protein